MIDASRANVVEHSRRPWYRLHLSTYVVLFFPLVALVLIMVPGPGYLAGGGGGQGTNVSFFEHGWPFVHLDRLDVETYPSPFGPGGDPARVAEAWAKMDEESPLWRAHRDLLQWATPSDDDWSFEFDEQPIEWMDSSSWPFHGYNFKIYRLALALNLATAVLICAAVAGSYEWWRRRRRKLWQFYLRELLVFVLVVAGALAWWRWLVTETQQETELIGKLEQDGFSVTRRCHAPVWLRKLAGVNHLHLFHRVDTITGSCQWDGYNIEYEATRDQPHPPIDLAANLRKNAAGLKHLRQIALNEVNNTTLKELEELPTITSLSLYGRTLTDEGLRWLYLFPQLEELDIPVHARPGDKKRITDAALVHLARLENLRVLRVPGASITNAGLARLATFSSLEHLDLFHSDITDDGIIHLKRMTHLRKLDITNTPVTNGAVGELRRALPNMQIRHWTRVDDNVSP